MVKAPLCVPIELRRDGTADRFVRLATGVSELGLEFPRPLPGALEGPLALRFHLPEDPLPLRCRGRRLDSAAVRDEATGELLSAVVRFVALDEASRVRIAAYVEERVIP